MELKGEARVGYSKNQQDFLASLDTVFIKQDNEYVEFEISSIRPNKNVMIIKFKGIDSINEILPYKGCLLFVEKKMLSVKILMKTNFLIDELVGLEVFDNNDGKNSDLLSGFQIMVRVI